MVPEASENDLVLLQGIDCVAEVLGERLDAVLINLVLVELVDVFTYRVRCLKSTLDTVETGVYE